MTAKATTVRATRAPNGGRRCSAKGRNMPRTRALATPQQRVQLNHVDQAAAHTKFHGIFGFESVEAFVFESYDEASEEGHRHERGWPLRREKYALQRLEALAHSA